MDRTYKPARLHLARPIPRGVAIVVLASSATLAPWIQGAEPEPLPSGSPEQARWSHERHPTDAPLVSPTPPPLGADPALHRDSLASSSAWRSRLSLQDLGRRTGELLAASLRWYQRTPPGDRVIWGGLTACAGLGLVVLLERMHRLRRPRIIPPEFTARFLDRLHEGKLDAGKALDYCEMHPSPAARVALAAVRRWGRPATDLERAVALAHRLEAERLWRNAATLRRIAAVAPLLGLLGSLFCLERVLQRLPEAAGQVSLGWGPDLAAGLSPLVAGIALAIFALVAYDAVHSRIERLSGALDRLGVETIDAIAMAAPPAHPVQRLGGAAQLAAPASRGNAVALSQKRGPHRRVQPQQGTTPTSHRQGASTSHGPGGPTSHGPGAPTPHGTEGPTSHRPGGLTFQGPGGPTAHATAVPPHREPGTVLPFPPPAEPRAVNMPDGSPGKPALESARPREFPF
jgi:biopolymer transport protein ExbB